MKNKPLKARLLATKRYVIVCISTDVTVISEKS